MGKQSMEQVMAVLPDTLGDDERRVGVELAKHLHPHFLGVNEAMLLPWVVRVSADDLPTFRLQRRGEDSFHFRLFGPALLIGGETKIAVGHQVNVFRFQWCSGFHNQSGPANFSISV